MTRGDSPPELLVVEPSGPYARLAPAVVDASVVAAVLFDEINAAEAIAVIERVELHAPDLLDQELVSVALKKARNGFDAAASRGLRGLLRLEILRHPVDVSLQFDIARRHDLSAYDAAYLALAVELGCPLITFDRRLAAAARKLLQGG